MGERENGQSHAMVRTYGPCAIIVRAQSNHDPYKHMHTMFFTIHVCVHVISMSTHFIYMCHEPKCLGFFAQTVTVCVSTQNQDCAAV